MKRPVRTDQPEMLEEFLDYLKFLKEEGKIIRSDLKWVQKEYLKFLFFRPVMENNTAAAQTRWATICHVADTMGLDPNSEDDRMFMLGILAWKDIAPVPKIVKRPGRPKGPAKWTKDMVKGLERDVLQVWPANKRKNWGIIARLLARMPKYKGKREYSRETLRRYWRDKVTSLRDE